MFRHIKQVTVVLLVLEAPLLVAIYKLAFRIRLLLRSKPAVKMTGKWEIRGEGKRIYFNAEDMTIGCSQQSAGYLGLDITVLSGVSNWSEYHLVRSNNGSAQIIFDANL